MAMNDIVNINITRETKSTAVANFGVPLILGKAGSSSASGTDKVTLAATKCSSLDAVDTALKTAGVSNPSDNDIHKIAAAIFRQNPCVANVVIATGAGTSASADLAAARNKEDFYAVILTPSLDDKDFTDGYSYDVVSWCESNRKIPFFQTSAVPSTSTPWMSSERAVMMYHSSAKSSQHAEASWVGEGLPYDAGSATWAYKTLNGVDADSLTDAQISTLESANINYYITMGGVDITREGRVANGEWIDIIIGTDWIYSRMQESIYSTLVNARKIPCNEAGLSIIRGKILDVLTRAASQGIIDADTIEITLPKITSEMKRTRVLTDIKFSAVYQGAVHAVRINGTLSY